MNAGLVLLTGVFLFGGDTDKATPDKSPEEHRLQTFWNGYYGAVRQFYSNIDCLDWVAFYKNHGTQINNGSGRIQYAPILPTPPVNLAPWSGLPTDKYTDGQSSSISNNPDRAPRPLSLEEALAMALENGSPSSRSNSPGPWSVTQSLRPLGTWKREVGDCRLTWRIETDRLFGTCRLSKESATVTLEMEADYSVTKDSIMFGVISSLDVTMQGNEDDEAADKEAVKNARAAVVKFIDQPFSIRYRVDDGVLTVKDVKIAGIGIRQPDREDELLAVLVGKYTAAATIRASSQPLPEPKAKRKDGKPSELTKAFAALVQQAAPKSAIKPVFADNTVVLTGTVERDEHVQRVVNLAELTWSPPLKVINSLRVVRPKEVPQSSLQVELNVVAVRLKRSEVRHLASGSLSKEKKYYSGSFIAKDVEPVRGHEGKIEAGLLKDPDNFFRLVSILREHRRARVITYPSITTANGKCATINVGKTSVHLEPTVLPAQGLERGRCIVVAEYADTTSSGDLSKARHKIDTPDSKVVAIGGRFETTEKKIAAPAPFMEVPFLNDALGSVCYDEVEEEVILLITPRLVERK